MSRRLPRAQLADPLASYLRAAHDAGQKRAEQLAADLAVYAGAHGKDGPTQQQKQRVANGISELREAERHVGRGEVLLHTEVEQ